MYHAPRTPNQWVFPRNSVSKKHAERRLEKNLALWENFRNASLVKFCQVLTQIWVWVKIRYPKIMDG